MTAVQQSAADRDRATVEPLDTRSLLQRCPAWVLVAASIAVLAGSAVTAIGLGPLRIPFTEVYAVLADTAMPWAGIDSGSSYARHEVVLGIRAPRVVLAIIVGAGLPVAGAIIQAILRNPLADPYLIGVSTGAGLGAVASLLFAALIPVWLGQPLTAFAGSMLAFGLVIGMARRSGQLTPIRLVLAGVAVAAFLAALTQWLIISASDEGTIRQALTWLLGSLTSVQFDQMPIPAIAVALGLTAGLAASGWLDALALGEEAAQSIGVDIVRFRWTMVSLSAAVVGTLVSVSGAIGFVALIVPHAVRLLVGSAHRRLLPLAAIWGAIFLVWADVLARIVRPGVEIPLGVVTALVGAPVFLSILRRTA
ncbi:MAG: iron ABC transporter permease [Micropruina sp.]|nr:iron ABC transporter permease [Micropruina sp.]